VNPNDLLGPTLRDVSRAFYLTLRVLPTGMREPVGLAYLLARAADTVADTPALPAEERLRHLLGLREQVEGGAAEAGLDELARLAGPHDDPGERRLLRRLPEAFRALDALPASDGARVRSIVSDLTVGMEFDLRTFPAENSGRLVALADLEALDRYTYHVAGCVGEFWTATSMAHTSALAGWDGDAMARLGVRFGKALQLTNVLRDVPRDLRIGRCYLPQSRLFDLGLAPRDLLEASCAARARPVLVEGIEIALDHFAAAERYLFAIPRRCYRLRLAVLWPLLIGLGTLARLARNADWLDPASPSRVSRNWIYLTLAASMKLEPSNVLLRAWIARLRRDVRRAAAR